MAFWEQEATDIAELQQSVRVAFCIPHTGMTTYAHVQGLIQSIMTTQGYHLILLMQSGTPVDLSRNIMVTRGLQQNVGKFFFVDSDMLLDQNTFLNMVAANMPVLSAAYMSRSPPFDMMANLQGHQLSRETVAKSPVRQYITVDEIGMGCCLIDRIVFERIAKMLNTWRCMTDHKPDGLDATVKYSDIEAQQQGYKCKLCGNLLVAPFFWNRIGFFDHDAVSEDYWFCKLAQKAGFDVAIVNNLVVGHEPRIADWFINQDGLQTRNTNAGDIKSNPNKTTVGVMPQ